MAAKAVSLAKSIKVSFTKGQNPWCIASKGTISHKKECLPIEQNCKCANVQMCKCACPCVPACMCACLPTWLQFSAWTTSLTNCLVSRGPFWGEIARHCPAPVGIQKTLQRNTALGVVHFCVAFHCTVSCYTKDCLHVLHKLWVKNPRKWNWIGSCCKEIYQSRPPIPKLTWFGVFNAHYSTRKQISAFLHRNVLQALRYVLHWIRSVNQCIGN